MVFFLLVCRPEQSIWKQLVTWHKFLYKCIAEIYICLWCDKTAKMKQRNGFYRCGSWTPRGQLQNHLSNQGWDYITFKHNTPSASHMVGVWERRIRTVRNVLPSLTHDFGASLDDESLRTFLCKMMAIVNCWPLTVDGLNDPLTAEPLTPNHLLTM